MHSINKKTLSLFLPMVIAFSVFGQVNLVPNPSFEDTVACPTTTGELFNASGWGSPTIGSPDYFNSCHSGGDVGIPFNFFGNQFAYHGEAYAGFGAFQEPDVREYIQVQLDSTLEAGVDYCATYYVSLAEVSGYSIKQVGMYFSNTPISSVTNGVLAYSPQLQNEFFVSDSTAWIKLTGSFTASGGEEFLTIGNFNNDMNTDTNAVSSMSNACYYYIDSIEVRRCGTSMVDELNIDDIKVYPNPATDIINIDPGEYAGIRTVTLYNALGEVILKRDDSQMNSYQFDIQQFNTNIMTVKVELYEQVFYYKILKL